MSAFAAAISEFLAHLWLVVGWAYFIVGFGVVIYVGYRARWWRTPPNQVWERRDNAPNFLDIFFHAGSFHPIVFLVQVARWPLWILFLWAYQADDADDD